MVKMVAFDFDGTIADTIPMCIEAFKRAISPYVGHDLTKEEIIQTFGLNEIGMVKSVVKDNFDDALKDFYLYYKKMHNRVNKPFPKICELIKYLKDNGVIVALITGKGQRSCEISLQKLGIKNYFTDIMVGDENYNNKTESILKLLEKYRIKNNEFYYVGDAVSDVTVSREANVTCLSAAWCDNSDLEMLKLCNSDLIFSNVSDLKEFLVKSYINIIEKK